MRVTSGILFGEKVWPADGIVLSAEAGNSHLHNMRRAKAKVWMNGGGDRYAGFGGPYTLTLSLHHASLSYEPKTIPSCLFDFDQQFYCCLSRLQSYIDTLRSRFHFVRTGPRLRWLLKRTCYSARQSKMSLTR